MTKPSTLKDLLVGGHISPSEVRKIAESIFDGKTTGAGPEGYVITACKFSDLSEHVQKFAMKAILAFTVENVFDTKASDKEDSTDELDSVEHEGATDEPTEDDPHYVEPGTLNPVKRKTRRTRRPSKLDS